MRVSLRMGGQGCEVIGEVGWDGMGWGRVRLRIHIIYRRRIINVET